MTTHALYLVRMDVAHDHEATFNEVYDKEHVPLLKAVPGVRSASRYRQPSATEPRYMAAYEMDNAAVLQSAAWKAAGEAGRWPKEIRPHTMNRHIATYEWVGSNAGLTYRTPYVFWVFMDVEKHREDLFNELYDTEHVPLLQAVPGVVRASRYRSPSPTDPRYIAAYELESAAVLQSAEWKTAGEAGRWAKEIRPHTMNRHLAMYEWVGGAPALTNKTPYVYWVMMDVEPHREALFNELYETEHLPLLSKLPGLVNVVRYRTATAGEARYLAAYEVETAELPTSKLWNDTSDTGRWKPDVRPYTYNKHWILGERISG